jgi:hypothetical protein
MSDSKSTDALTIREIEYSIHIKDKDRGFHELHDLLYAELTRFEDKRVKGDKRDNPIRNFLQNNIERSIAIRDSTKVYFLNYQEHGSLTIKFKLLVICRYINYGTTRQALDFLIKDTIGDYFEEVLERHLPVSVSVQSSDNELYEIHDNQPDRNTQKKQQKRDYLPVLLASLALFISLAVFTFWIIQKFQQREPQKPAEEYKDKYFELLIEKKVNEVIEMERYTRKFQEEHSAIDSGQSVKSGNKQP